MHRCTPSPPCRAALLSCPLCTHILTSSHSWDQAGPERPVVPPMIPASKPNQGADTLIPASVPWHRGVSGIHISFFIQFKVFSLCLWHKYKKHVVKSIRQQFKRASTLSGSGKSTESKNPTNVSQPTKEASLILWGRIIRMKPTDLLSLNCGGWQQEISSRQWQPLTEYQTAAVHNVIAREWQVTSAL